MRNRTGNVIFVNGRVLSGESETECHSGLAIRHGRVMEAGSDDDVLKWRAPGVEVIDLAGRSAAPGLNDAHCHPMMLGHGLTQVNAATPPNRTVGDIVAAVASRVRETPAGEWVQAHGYDQARLDDQRHPTRQDLDPVSPENPVLVQRACYHIGVANSRALNLAGITRDTPNPSDGEIDRDEHGEPTGVLRESALNLVRDIIPAPNREQMKAGLIAAGKQYLSQGVTSVAEAGIRDSDHLRAYEELNETGELPVRSYLMMMIDETLDELESLGIKTGFGDEWVRVGPAKLFLDGSIGGRTARMSEPYLDEPDNYGLWMYDPDEVKAKFMRAHKAGFQLCAHAIGDAAITLLLDAYEEALAAEPREDHRHRIEHCSIVDMDLIHRIKRVGAVPIPGTSFLYYFNKAYIQNLGWDRIRYAYGMNTFYEHGIVAAASTDAPVVNTNAMIGMQTMMTRRSEEGDEMWIEEAVPLHEALRAYTWNGAYASFEENIKGTLKPGKVGDVVVFNTDITEVNPGEMSQVQVDMTITDGHIAYSREG